MCKFTPTPVQQASNRPHCALAAAAAAAAHQAQGASSLQTGVNLGKHTSTRQPPHRYSSRSIVLLPLPLVPTTAQLVPAGTLKLTPFRISESSRYPNFTPQSSTSKPKPMLTSSISPPPPAPLAARAGARAPIAVGGVVGGGSGIASGASRMAERS